jgi:hypothetical protein
MIPCGRGLVKFLSAASDGPLGSWRFSTIFAASLQGEMVRFPRLRFSFRNPASVAFESVASKRWSDE